MKIWMVEAHDRQGIQSKRLIKFFTSEDKARAYGEILRELCWFTTITEEIVEV